MGDINRNSQIDFYNVRKVDTLVYDDHKLRYTLKQGDFIFGKIGTVGKPIVLPEPFEYILSANVVLFQPKLEYVVPKFVYYYMSSPFLDKLLNTSSRVTTHAAFGIKRVRKLPFPLPPLAEQRRIVAKVDELMALCDELEARLRQAQAEGGRLLAAMTGMVAGIQDSEVRSQESGAEDLELSAVSPVNGASSA
jgi:type I restriction enzyme S subunit